MANVDDVKEAIEDVVPGRSRGRGRLPKALLIALVAGVAAWASRLEPVRSAVHTAVSTIQTRVASITGSGESAASKETWSAPATTGAALGASGTGSPAAGLAGSEMAGDTAGAETPVGIGLDDTTGGTPDAGSDVSIPADSEEGRPAGV